MNETAMCRRAFYTDNGFYFKHVKVVNSKHSGDICSIENVDSMNESNHVPFVESTVGVPVVLLESTVTKEQSRGGCFAKVSDFEKDEIVLSIVLQMGMTFIMQEMLFDFTLEQNDYFYLNFEKNKIQKEKGDCNRFLKMKVLEKTEHYDYHLQKSINRYHVIVWYDQT